MKQVKVKIETAVETTLGGKPVNEILKDIVDLCHERLEYSTSKEKECEMLYEDNKYELVYDKMSDRASALEEALRRILTLLDD